MKFQVKDKVVPKDSIRAHTNYLVSEVVAYLDGNVLTMMWGDGFGDEIHYYDFLEDTKPSDRSWGTAIHRYQESDLFTPEEAITELRRLEAIKDNLNEEFEGVRANIQAKLDAAAVLVEEAAAIAKPFNKELDDLSRDECRKLYEAQEKNGWRASHVRC
jgi:hypothetical protein